VLTTLEGYFGYRPGKRDSAEIENLDPPIVEARIPDPLSLTFRDRKAANSAIYLLHNQGENRPTTRFSVILDEVNGDPKLTLFGRDVNSLITIRLAEEFRDASTIFFSFLRTMARSASLATPF